MSELWLKKLVTKLNNPKMEECLAYFRGRSVYQKLFVKFRDKYASLGHVGGTVKLTNLTPKEKQDLGGFLQKDLTNHKTVSVSAALLNKALVGSRYAGLEWETIIEHFFGQPLYAKKELAQKAADQKANYFTQIIEETGSAKAGQWLVRVLEERLDGCALLMQQYQLDADGLTAVLRNVLKTIPKLPAFAGQVERLAVFAAATTGDPHYYDEGTVGERLLTAFISDYFGKSQESAMSRVERKNHLLYQAGILRDDLSNHVLAFGFRAETGHHKCHEGIEGFYREKEPMHLSLLTLGRLEEIWSDYRQIYVVENPSFFSALIDYNSNVAVICTNGQPRLAVLVLLDLLAENHTFYYAGDFDPEGLVIAQNLKKRYQEKLLFWNYKRQYYECCKSNVTLSTQSLKKLDKIQDAGLIHIKKALLEEKKAAYQETMLAATDFLETVYLEPTD